MLGSLSNRFVFPGVRTYTAHSIPSPPLIMLAGGVPCLKLEPVVRQAAAPTILFLHGNTSDLGKIWRRMQLVATQLRCTIVCMEYRGYGIHPGAATPDNVLTDARRVLREVVEHHNAGRPVHVMGFSIGTGVAAQLVRHEHALVRTLTLVAPFTSLFDVVQPIAGKVGAALSVGNAYNTRRAMRQIPASVPLLILHGDADDVIPVAQGMTLYLQRVQQMPHASTHLKILPGVTHQVPWDAEMIRIITDHIRSTR